MSVRREMARWLARAAFYPSRLYNHVLDRLVPGRSYWDEVDDVVVLGSMPLPRHVDELHALGVRGVINMCDEYAGPEALYRRAGIRQLHLPTIDFVAPSLEDVRAGVAFLREHERRGERVYVHCKAGRGRSATVVLCWLMERRGLAAREAQRLLNQRRRQVVENLWKREVVQRFADG